MRDGHHGTLFLTCALVTGLAAPAQGVTPVGRLPLSIVVVEMDGGPAVDDAWLAEQVDNASMLFGRFGLCFRDAARRSLAPRFAHLETREDRHALAAFFEAGAINVFVVAGLRDVDDPSLMRRGVHWRPRVAGALRPDRHFVIVSSAASPTTLAHELGHFFGEPHSRVPGNLMSYLGRSGMSAFDDSQGRRMVARARRFLRSRALRALPGDGCP